MSETPIESELHQFKTRMLISFPFYGDILLRLPIVRDESVPTACTDGRTIRWNSRFFIGLTPGQRHYVLMHEVLHTLLRHPLRMKGKDPEIWNVAADIIVNRICDALVTLVRGTPGLTIERPPEGIYIPVSHSETVENLYGIIKRQNRHHPKGMLRLSKNYGSGAMPVRESMLAQTEAVRLPAADLINGGKGTPALTDEEEQALEENLRALIRGAAGHDRGASGSLGYIPKELASLVRPKPIDWRTLLREFLSETQSDETSYATPERKYLHMGLILPGHSLKEEGDLESVWAFVDSSGSISQADLNQFLTQLHKIVKDFHCVMNIAYWDTQVTDVYEKLRTEKQVLTAQPKHSGGTDINCVYRYVRDRHLRPLVTLILTDGYFGIPQNDLIKTLNPHKTILLISNSSQNSVYKTIGRVCRLKPDS